MAQSKIRAAKEYSGQIIKSLREALGVTSAERSISIVIVGSLARGEASSFSDLDYFLVSDGNEVSGQVTQDNVVIAAKNIGLREPSAGGAFGGMVSRSNLLDIIGGEGDSNSALTRRMLFLLESDWIGGRTLYDAILTEAVERYISEKITQHQIARFLLNDLIRYYRTICVDFEFKTVSVGKSWGDRNIKLMFSRRLLYFSGVLAVAATAQSAWLEKRRVLSRLLCMTPIERIQDICGDSASQLLDSYNDFLGWMADATSRKLLSETTSDKLSHSEAFREMKNAGHHFSWHLERLLQRTFASSHPIHQALIL